MDRRDLTTIYRDLRTTARRLLDREPYAHTLESSELVNEAFTRLLGGSLRDAAIADPGQFVALAVLDMRRELVDHARRRRAAKRPDPRRRVDLDDVVAMCDDEPHTFLAVDQLIDALAADPTVRNGARKAEVARYALYAGLTEAEIAAALAIPKSTVGADLRFARARIAAQLEAADERV